MSYRLTYRGLFDNVLATKDAVNSPIAQTVRVDISDVQSGIIAATAIVGNVTLGFSSAALIFVAAGPGATPAAEMVAFFTGAQGKAIRVSGTPGGISDGDYIITNDPVISGGGLVANVEVNIIRGPGGTAGENTITIEDISEPSIIPLSMTGDPLHISTIDNNEDKFTPIRSKQAEIKIFTGNGLDINTFCEGDDGRFYVEIFVDNLIIFRGFLIIPDLQQDFQPDPNILILTATDNIGTLKDIPLVDFDGAVPVHENAIIMYLAWALNKTTINQNINIINNLVSGQGAQTITATFVYSGDTSAFTVNNADAAKLFVGEQIVISGTASNDSTVTITSIVVIDPFIQEIITTGTFVAEGPVSFTATDSASGRFYESNFLNAKTFEDQIGTRIDCYETIRRILTEDCVVFQSKGEYYIVRIDEIEDFSGIFQMNVDTYDYQGTYVSTALKTFSKAIGISENMWWCNDDAIVIPDRPYQRVRETFKYDYPQEIICNIDFSRGTFIGDLPDETVDGVANQVKSYAPECWTYIKGYPVLTQDSDGYVKKYYVNGQEKQRFLFADTAVTDNYYYWRSDEMVPMEQNSKFNFNLDVKYSTDLGGGSGHFDIAQAQIRLYGNDGSHWTLHADYGTGSSDPGPRWVLSDSTWSTNNNYVRLSGDAGSTDFTQWNNVSGDTAPLPVSGLVEFFLMNNQTSDSQTKSFTSLKIDYFPFINGSYQKYTGQYNQVSQELGNRAARDNQVYISDAPAQLIKGALLNFNGIAYYLASLFTDHNWSTPTSYGKIEVFAVWNQYRLSARNFEGNVDFIDTDTTLDSLYDGADLIHKYDLTDSNGSTNDRYFMALHFDQDFYLLTWKAFIASVQQNKVYTDTFLFQYITT